MVLAEQNQPAQQGQPTQASANSQHGNQQAGKRAGMSQKRADDIASKSGSNNQQPGLRSRDANWRFSGLHR
jgi:hypothetical protein